MSLRGYRGMYVAPRLVQTLTKDQRMPDNTNKKNPNQLDKDQDKQRQGNQGQQGGMPQKQGNIPKQGDIGKQGGMDKEKKGVDLDDDDLKTDE